ncbi:hypothetical protein [Aeromicrobium terrae]|uniref:Uncharacterized protein n=1 Tax=Aeromicrobium terrae TaxID=2498846 RepID=A0A5C8NLP7_9ACTN|nr:hypothetical protein [Aeromicrobium terrae]TXL61825.1 hypothetical protein FHP06_03620 [Aeromicrobium terrae]
MPVPDFLPTLSAGAHDEDAGEACVMEYVSLLAGEPWSDRPECTHPLLAHEAHTANDLLLDADRPRLVPLIGRLFGTTDDSDEIRARLRLRQARQVAQLIAPDARGPVLAIIERAEVGDPGLSYRPDVPHVLDPEHRAVHQQGARIGFFVSPDAGPRERWALAALGAAHLAAATECRADCGDPSARARRMVKDLAGLIDEYDAVTDRVPAALTAAQVGELADAF